MSGRGGVFSLHGAVNMRGEPFVITEVNGEPFGQLTPREAMNLGTRAIQAAIEAERDAATLVAMRKFGIVVVGDPESADRFAASIIQAIRDNRGQVDPDPAQDVKPGDER
ncbi:hypothetical protein [Mycobacterium sp.]|uniref:hypothetical protein n=1 Tax=Mycobacterium sp. TaxID=1785 RepID=UPI0026388865|nr:hypothetical protein [Mycobacterium sp.]